MRALLQATAAAGERPAAIAFGNELIGHHGIAAKLAVGDYVTGLRQLHAMLVDAWPSQPPLMLAPDSKLDPPWFASMLDELMADDTVRGRAKAKFEAVQAERSRGVKRQSKRRPRGAKKGR